MDKIEVTRRNEQFRQRASTKITKEIPSDENPFLAKKLYTHGYDQMELMEKCSYTDIVHLLFNGELPSPQQSKMFALLAAYLVNLGPRQVAARAAMNAAVGRTATSHIVPIAMLAMSGDYNGAEEVEAAMKFLRDHADDVPEELARSLCSEAQGGTNGDQIVAPGFGSDFGGQPPRLLEVLDRLFAHCAPNGAVMWAKRFVSAISMTGCGWRQAGLVASVLVELGFQYRQGGGVFQILAAPGAFAHGVDFSTRPITDIPFIDDEAYLEGLFKREGQHE